MFVLPRKPRAPQGPLKLNPDSSLASGLVFAWAGSQGKEHTTGLEPTNTNVRLIRGSHGPAWNFVGGGPNTSELNFGAYAATNDLHEHAATWMFYAMAGQLAGGIPTQTAMAAQNDGNTVNAGWQIYNDPSGGITFECERGTTNLQRIWNESWLAFVPQVLIVTYDGTNNVSGTAAYLDAVPLTVKSGHNGSGATGPASAQNLYLGSRRFNTALSHQGDLMVAMMANRVWAPEEIIGASRNPYGAFRPRRATIYSFSLPSLVVDITGPAAGPIGPDDEITWTIAPDDFPSALTAAITLPDGSAELGWNYDQASAAYNGTVVVGGLRTYTISRKLGFPLGPIRLDLSVTDAAGTTTVTASREWTVAAPAGAFIAQALSRVIVQYRNSPKLLAEITGFAYLGQQLADLFNAIPPLDDIATATGENLALIGELVGQNTFLANGDVATDSEYRVLIGARITRNTARVTGEAFLAALVQFFQAPIQLEDFGGMAISYGVGRTPTADEVALLDEDIVARPMGVRVDRYFFDTADYFGFDEDPDAKGYGDTDTDPDGGGYSTGF